ncbi:hypothetical protein L6164_027675 [Bauhinia variegata]|uniref:Uncharacterized protein n=1 Tax=Bauhinia variegata TaxID=167791 RepID=A0ACB9LU43_BAUVA|nr:hypothetical protein L6164_027675 [Bauhinia variegata]
MALFKSRGNRRSSSTSYASTLTTLVFIAVCVLGVWMLTSNTVVPTQPETQATTRTAIDTITTANNDFSSSSEDSSETTTTATTKGNEQKDGPVFGDNPGQLPEDAIKSDEKKPSANTGNEVQKEAVSTSESQISEESLLTQKQQASETNIEASSELDRQSDKKVSESEKVQQTSTSDQGGSEGNQKNEEQIAKSQSNENPDTKTTDNRESQDVKVKETKDIDEVAKNAEDELNKQQLREDKGEISQQSQKQGPQEPVEEQQKKQDETGTERSQQESQELSAGNAGLRRGGPQLSQQKTQDESEDTQKPKTEKKQMDEDKTGNAKAKSSKSFTSEKESKKSWSTQVDQSQNEKKRQKNKVIAKGITWLLCNVTAGADYIPCLDNEKALKLLHSTKHFEHRERHCPTPEEAPTCLVPAPKGYKTPVEWPSSRDKIWYHNVPHTKLVEVKGHQNWVKVSGEFLVFPGGGTQFIHGALHYIDFIQQAEPNIAWGKHTRVVLDVGCGVGSFGGFQFERDVLTMSFAPKDEHEAQVQFALERGIPAISAVMGSQRLPFPARVFDLVHCARCRVPWHVEGGKLLLELNRVLRPGGYFVWSATPVYQKLEEDVQIWKEMSSLTAAMCWELVTINRDTLNSIGAAIYRKPNTNECYEQREKDLPPMCKEDDDANAAWYVPLQACMHRNPVNEAERGAKWPESWPARLQKVPYWLNNSQVGIYGKPASQDFAADNERWRNVVDELSNIGITWSNVRNVMDMRAIYGGFAAALRDLPVWVFNVVNVHAPDTLPIIYERGLFGIYHDWCESFSTYPRTYDLLHSNQLFSQLKKRCNLVPVLTEVDRIVRPGGKLIVRDDSITISEVERLLKSLHWEIPFSKKQEGLLWAKKGTWRPKSYADSS